MNKNKCNHIMGYAYYYCDIYPVRLAEQLNDPDCPHTWLDCDYCPECGAKLDNEVE